MARDQALQPGTNLRELLERHRRHVHLAVRIAAFAAVQSRDEQGRVAEQPVEIRDRPAAHQRHGAVRGRAQPGEQLPELRIHEHGARVIRELEQGSIHVEKQTPGSRGQRHRVYGGRFARRELHHPRSI